MALKSKQDRVKSEADYIEGSQVVKEYLVACSLCVPRFITNYRSVHVPEVDFGHFPEVDCRTCPLGPETCKCGKLFHSITFTDSIVLGFKGFEYDDEEEEEALEAVRKVREWLLSGKRVEVTE